MRLALVLPAAALLLAACSGAQEQAVQAPPPPPPSTTTTSSPEPEPEPKPQPVVVPSAPCTASTVRACVSLSQNLAWLMKDGVAEYGPVPITHGKPGHETPVGTFKVAWKDAVHTSSIYGLPMPHSVFFAAGGIAFHEGPLDEPSHGCVHLSPEVAKVFFDALPVKAGVQVMA